MTLCYLVTRYISQERNVPKITAVPTKLPRNTPVTGAPKKVSTAILLPKSDATFATALRPPAAAPAAPAMRISLTSGGIMY